MSTRSPRPRLSHLATAFLVALVLSCTSSSGCSASEASEHVPEFDEVRAFADLEAQVAIGPRWAGGPGGRATREYIVGELREAGLDPTVEAFEPSTPMGKISMANVVVEIEGVAVGGEPAPIVILATHFDTKRFDFDFEGANDSASGTACLLGIARALSGAPPAALTYHLVFLDGEESVRKHWKDPDNRYGSRHHVEQLRRNGLLPRVRACVLIDMVGDAELRLTREEFSDQRLLGLFFATAREMGLGRHVGARAQRVYDDHLSFMEADIPSADLIDFEYGPNGDYWHDERDTVDKCSAESLGIVGRIVLRTLPKLAEFR